MKASSIVQTAWSWSQSLFLKQPIYCFLCILSITITKFMVEMRILFEASWCSCTSQQLLHSYSYISRGSLGGWVPTNCFVTANSRWNHQQWKWFNQSWWSNTRCVRTYFLNTLGAVQVSCDHIWALSRPPRPPLWSRVIIWHTPPPPHRWSHDTWMGIVGENYWNGVWIS